MAILKKIGIPDKKRTIIAHLYWNQQSCSQVRSETAVCSIHTTLFNAYSKTFARKDELKIGDKHISNIRYADDTMLMSDSLGRMITFE